MQNGRIVDIRANQAKPGMLYLGFYQTGKLYSTDPGEMLVIREIKRRYNQVEFTMDNEDAPWKFAENQIIRVRLAEPEVNEHGEVCY